MEERNIKIQARCRCCDGITELLVTQKDLNEYFSSNRRHIQDIFPYLRAEERELLISQICPKCWNDMFGSDEEDEDYEPTAEDLKEWQDASCGRV